MIRIKAILFGLSLFIFSNFASAQLTCADLFANGSFFLRHGLIRGAYVSTTGGELVKVLETPNSSATHIKAQQMGDRSAIAEIPIVELAPNSVVLQKVESITLTVQKHLVLPMKTRLMNIHGDEFFFFTGRIVKSQNVLLVEVMSNRRDGLFLRPANGLLPASAEDVVRSRKIEEFGFEKWADRWRSSIYNFDGIHRFHLEPVTQTLFAKLSKPDSAPDSSLRAFWRHGLSLFRIPIQIPAEIGKGWAVYYGHEDHIGGRFFKFAFFKTVSEAVAFLETFPRE